MAAKIALFFASLFLSVFSVMGVGAYLGVYGTAMPAHDCFSEVAYQDEELKAAIDLLKAAWVGRTADELLLAAEKGPVDSSLIGVNEQEVWVFSLVFHLDRGIIRDVSRL